MQKPHGKSRKWSRTDRVRSISDLLILCHHRESGSAHAQGGSRVFPIRDKQLLNRQWQKATTGTKRTLSYRYLLETPRTSKSAPKNASKCPVASHGQCIRHSGHVRSEPPNQGKWPPSPKIARVPAPNQQLWQGSSFAKLPRPNLATFFLPSLVGLALWPMARS